MGRDGSAVFGSLNGGIIGCMAARDEAIKSIENMSDTATWDDIMYRIYVRARISEGLKEAEAGNLIPHEEIKKRFSE
jgi:hypothetical protein